jgi:hypothetical protein
VTVVRRAWLVLLALATVSAAPRDPCQQASARLGRSVCVVAVPDRHAWEQLTVGQIPWTRYLVPARPDARLPVLFSDSQTFEYHFDLLATGFAPLFPGLDHDEAARLLYNPRHREFYAGNVQERARGFEFSVEEVAGAPVSRDEVIAVWTALARAFGVGELAFAPMGPQAEAVKGWDDLPFAVAGRPDPRPLEVYSAGETFGTVRRVTADDAAGYQDVLVFQTAPIDVAHPVAGLITGSPQGELSHLSVRSAARHTPDCYAADAWVRFAPWEGRSVHLVCDEHGLSITPADPADVAAFWADRKPAAVPVAAPDADWTALVGLAEMPTATADERALSLRRYGSKARNLAAIAQRVPFALDGFAIPVSAYLAYVAANGRAFDAPIDPALVTRVSDRIVAQFGETAMVRFRSSSNAEDALGFSGAGLYESTSVCVADDRDGDDVGPSRCDPETGGERGVARGLRKVWASLWTERAVAERDWYGIPADAVAMGILVDRRAAHEQANIVAFTAPPNGGDGFLVDAQAGELEVVGTSPGVWPESTLLTVVDGRVTSIRRVNAASAAAIVLSDERLAELGAALAKVQAVFPVDEAAPAGHDVALDTEWKILDDGRLALKQVRPFLR